jgi:catechol 2,3-dioxygenase-like lactoylglutathione lyase family enzyme
MANQIRNTSDPNFVILYVNDAAKSAAFYTDLLGRPPAQTTPTFAAFPLASGVTLGLWTRSDVQPKVNGAGDQAEICFPAADAAAVKTVYADWAKRGLPIAQQPTEMGFGHTFVALDPDGHRLRVFAFPQA